MTTETKLGRGLVVAGTYEKLLYGLNLPHPRVYGAEEVGSEQPLQLLPSFIYPTHLSSISSLSLGNSKYLATGSSDENIKLYDLKLRKEIGNLMIHTGTITCLAFIGKSHLISASQDGTIGLTRSSDWELLKKLKGHNGSVLDFSVHSSGKVLLSVGQDCTLKCWDLSRGLLSYSMKLSLVPCMVRWSTCGSRYLVLSDNTIAIFSIEAEKQDESAVVAKINSKARINSAVCLKIKLDDDQNEQNVVVYGGEDKILRVADIATGRILLNLATKHSLRIKDIAALNSLEMVATCSSEGLILVWDLRKLMATAADSEVDSTTITPVEDSTHAIVSEYDCKCRVTCLAFATGDTGEDRRQTIEKGRKQEADRMAKLNEMPESDYEQDMKNAARKKINIVVDENDSIQVASASTVASAPVKKQSSSSSSKVTLISQEKNPKGVSKKKRMKKPKLQHDSVAKNSSNKDLEE